MEKTRLGVTVGLFGTTLYLSALCGGSLMTILLAGYVLLFESDKWLKRAAIKATALVLLFGAASYIVNILPSAISVIDNFVGIFGGNFNINFVSRIVGIFSHGISIVKTLILTALTVSASVKGHFAIPILDSIINKNIE